MYLSLPSVTLWSSWRFSWREVFIWRTSASGARQHLAYLLGTDSVRPWLKRQDPKSTDHWKIGFFLPSHLGNNQPVLWVADVHPLSNWVTSPPSHDVFSQPPQPEYVHNWPSTMLLVDCVDSRVWAWDSCNVLNPHTWDYLFPLARCTVTSINDLPSAAEVQVQTQEEKGLRYRVVPGRSWSTPSFAW